jgi:hypothetical protein
MQIAITIPPRGQGLQPSIAYRRITPVNVTIQRDATDPPDPVLIDVIHCSAENGTASIVGAAELVSSNTVQIQGDEQTQPGHGGLLRVRARFSTQQVLSDGFSVCAHPCAVHNGPDHAPHVYIEVRQDLFDAALQATTEFMAGMYVELRIESDSGVDGDLDQVFDQEFVSAPLDHSKSMQGQPQNPPKQGGQEPATNALMDRHDIGVIQVITFAASLGTQSGHWSNDQLDKFCCQRCDPDNWHVISRSGYRVTRTISRGKHNRIRLSVIKEARGCTVEGVATAPGPSPTFEVLLDLEQRTVGANEELAELAALAGIGPG